MDHARRMLVVVDGSSKSKEAFFVKLPL